MQLADEAATHRFVRDIALGLEPGDLITLSGDLGAGKTTFARALIRHLAGDETIEVPSPTFTLIQTYDFEKLSVVHADLYRIGHASELTELGFDDLPDNALVLMEWPDRAGDSLPANRIDIAFTIAPMRGETFRNVTVTGYGSAIPRVARMGVVRAFLDQCGFAKAERIRIQGDASTRSYERLALKGQGFILMNSPRRPDGPPVRDGKPYSAIAHLAEDVTAFIAMSKGLRDAGLSAPAVYYADNDKGLLILEDLGNETVVRGEPPEPMMDRYGAAVEVLAALHRQTLPSTLQIEPRMDYRLPEYDLDAFLIESELLLDWYLPRMKATLSSDARDMFITLWRDALQPVLAAPKTWVLRDFHSPNLLWLPERYGVERVGVLDFQDAVMGAAAYDLASLLQDARVDAPESLEVTLLGRYARLRREVSPDFDTAAFVQIYATVAAQRATKILGIFARLDMRDGKPQYLRHMPRIWGYLQRSLAHPSLAPLRAWYATHVPALKKIRG